MAATEGVTPLFFPEKPGDFFSRQFCGVTPGFFSPKTVDLFCSTLSLSLSLFIAFTWVSPPTRGCHPTPFLPVRPRFSTILSILCIFLPTHFFLRVLPPWRVSPGAVRPLSSLVTSLFKGSALRQGKAGRSQGTGREEGREKERRERRETTKGDLLHSF